MAMDAYEAVLLTLRQIGYTEDADKTSMPLISHLLDDLQRSHLETKKAESECSEKEERIEKIQSQLNACNATIAQYESKASESKSMVDSNKQREKKNSNYSSDLPTSTAEFTEMLNTLITEKDKIVDENEEMHKQNDDLLKTVATQEDTIRNLQSEIEKLERDFSLYVTDRTTVVDCQKQLTELQDSYYTLQKEQRRIEEESKQSKQNEADLSLQLANKRSECKLLNESIHSLKSKQLSDLEEISRVNSMLQLEKGASHQFEFSFKQEKVRSERLEEKLRIAQQTIEETKHKLMAAMQREEKLNEEKLNSDKKEKETYLLLKAKREEYDTLESSYLGEKRAREHLDTENKNLKEELQAIRLTYQSFDTQLQTLKDFNLSQARELERLRKDVEEKTQLLKEMEKMLSRERAEATSKMAELRNAIAQNRRKPNPPATYTFTPESKENKEEKASHFSPLSSPHQEKEKPFTPINATPIKPYNSVVVDEAKPGSAEKNTNSSINMSSTTTISEALNNVSDLVSQVEKQLK